MTGESRPDPTDVGFMSAIGVICLFWLAGLIYVSMQNVIVVVFLGVILGVPALVGFVAYRLAKRQQRRADRS